MTRSTVKKKVIGAVREGDTKITHPTPNRITFRGYTLLSRWRCIIGHSMAESAHAG